MDLLAQYSGSDDAGAGGDTDDDVATTAAMLRAKHAVPDLAPPSPLASEYCAKRSIVVACLRAPRSTSRPAGRPNLQVNRLVMPLA